MGYRSAAQPPIESTFLKGTPTPRPRSWQSGMDFIGGPDQTPLHHQGEHLLPRLVPGHPPAGGP